MSDTMGGGAGSGDVEIEIVDPAAGAAEETKHQHEDRRPPPVRHRVDGFDDAEEYGFKVRKRIGKAIGELRAEQTRRAAIEAENAQLKASLAAERASRLGEREKSLAGELEQADADLRAATEAGDPAAQSKAMRRIAEASAEKTQVATGKTLAEQQRAAAEAHAKALPQQQPVLSAAVQDWVDNGNDWFMTDKAMRNDAVLQHHAAIGQGIKAETPEYFAFIDKRMRALHPDFFAGDGNGDGDQEPAPGAAQPSSGAQPQPTRPAQAPAAAPRRNVPGQSPPRPSTQRIQLSSEQVQLCKELGITPQAYAAQQAALKGR